MIDNNLQFHDFLSEIEILREQFSVLSQIYFKQSFQAQVVLQKYGFHYQWYCRIASWS